MSKVRLKDMTEDDMRNECESVLGTTYGHNIIALICQMAEKKFGVEVAEQLHKEYQI
tara:strand:+ start:382 stop:552 length:171 start_codon:yes stop_codon:yes gene_type:complete